MRVLANRYELVEAVGRGGMGEVWRATDRELGRTVAVKVLPPELTRHEEFRVRFRREARVVASLNHRNVAVLHDVGEDTTHGETTPFLVMEFIEGRTLTAALADGAFSVFRALAVARDIADALAHSHAQGLIHRDIKPSNVMLTSEGGVKVLDFGIAKVVAETTTRLTATGMTVGTPAYLSPEQLTGRPVDGRSDQYSSGCLLYELLTGRPPFLGDSPFAVMHQHISQEPVAPSRLRPQIPGVVDDLVLRTLAKDREQRHGSAAELREALAATLTALSAPADAASRTPAPAPGAPPAPAVPPARTKADTTAGPGHTALAQQETRTAPAPPRPAVPPPGGPVDGSLPGTADGSRTPYPAPTGDGPSPAPGERRFALTGGRTIALLGLVVSGVVALGCQDMYADSSDELVDVWVAAAVLGLVLFRWLPFTSTLLWWGAGALVTAGVAIGGGVDDYGYTSVTESDFSTLYYYDSSYGAYYELPADSSGHRLFEDDYSGGYDPAQADVGRDYTAHDPIEILAAPALVLATLCLFRALSRRRLSPLAAAAGLTLGGVGVGWLALGQDEQTGVFAVAWGVVVVAAVVQEIRARRNAPPSVRRRLRFVTAE
ncbi:serine/threonine-protein kinase [Streptomyces rishiriensis]|uniref:non-specific serine/threonine protein kinase n=1 Tax=Streptomyces rishiriensis TaxID=68264 RepID=A0ABU0NJE2_STRRH|nr:serine/threonine-protein kinase [Streptomyces rishiriensis]MDQ0578843.1 tRNA A-37 threonylcarbamoyl transferase component Bud32 [Streptomyces rishiriensis]